MNDAVAVRLFYFLKISMCNSFPKDVCERTCLSRIAKGVVFDSGTGAAVTIIEDDFIIKIFYIELT